MAQAELEYNVASMRLKGNIDGFLIDTLAYSGGRGGTKTAGAANERIINNPLLSSLKYTKGVKGSIGGPLPSGLYKLMLHSKVNEVKLIPVSVVNNYGRGEFLIHGRGKIGSQGCIVPQNFNIVQKIYNSVKERQGKNKTPIMIRVYATGDIDYYLRKIHSA